MIVDENALNSDPRYLNKYWLKTTMISSQKSIEDVAWVMSTTNMFHDPRTHKDYEVYLPVNYSLIALIE